MASLAGIGVLLAKARSVVLTTVTGEPRQRDGGIPPVEIAELPLEGRSVAQIPTGAAAAREASHLVMGAYGHSRFVETVWGCVTREFVAEPPLPILAAH